jgi:hypothetical protein
MKNQYFGDINDYRKYGLLRLLSANGNLRVGVCWMLTAPDSRSDGKFIDYIHKNEKYCRYDSDLFNILKTCLSDVRGRCVSFADERSVIPNAVYFTELLSDNKTDRLKYFGEFAEKSRDRELVFFDPDNGIEIKSTRKGRKDSCKYLYWDELQQTYASGKSVLFYQHFRREKRETTIASLSGEIRERLGAPKVMAFRTAHVLFLLIPQPTHQEQLERQGNSVVKQWHPEITLG